MSAEIKKFIFLLYEKEIGKGILLLPDLPDNDFEAENDIYYKGQLYVGGIKWATCDWIVFDPIELDPPEANAWIYNKTTGRLELNPEWSDE